MQSVNVENKKNAVKLLLEPNRIYLRQQIYFAVQENAIHMKK